TRTLQSIGRNSMHYLVVHWMLIDLSQSMARHLFQIENPYAIFLIVAGTNAVFLPIISRILKTAFVRKYLVL
ncbi:hypothetical protein, partial [uncultured Fibrobacter sp.]|uniref:hypothetical protein n=1 Tax=uncultured Fibrobacter sp. TaxID=261512 RepID=UPI0028043218